MKMSLSLKITFLLNVWLCRTEMGKDLNKASRDAIPINLTKVYNSHLYSYITVVDVVFLLGVANKCKLSPPALYINAAVL